jgi:hypothetical protein
VKIKIEIDETLIRELIANHVREQLGSLTLSADDVKLYVKSKQNYRSTWEECSIIVTNEPSGSLELDLKRDRPEVKAEVKT